MGLCEGILSELVQHPRKMHGYFQNLGVWATAQSFETWLQSSQSKGTGDTAPQVTLRLLLPLNPLSSPGIFQLVEHRPSLAGGLSLTPSSILS